MMTSPRLLLAVVSVLAPCSAALAHDFILWPRPGHLPAPGEVRLELWVGDHLAFEEQRGFQVERADRFDRVDASGAHDLLAGRVDADPPFATVALDHPGGHTLVLDRPAVSIELPADRFEHYLEHERLAGVVRERARRDESQRPGRERYTRHIKTFVQVGDRFDSAGCRAMGQPLEVVPLIDPARLAEGQVMEVELRRDGRALADHPLEAMTLVEGRPRSTHMRTDARGRARLRLDNEGEWLLRSVNMRRCEQNCDEVDWESRWAAYTFHVGARGSHEPTRCSERRSARPRR